MALKNSSDETCSMDKLAMQTSKSSSGSNLSSSDVHSSIGLCTNSQLFCGSVDNSTEFSPNILTPKRRSLTEASSLPRVHSTRRTVLSRKESHPDLINSHHQQTQLLSESLSSELSELNGTLLSGGTTAAPDFSADNCSRSTSNNPSSDFGDPSKSLLLLPKCKLNAPGKSFIVSGEVPCSNVQNDPLPVVTADKLRPYSPSLITVIKEGVSGESTSSLYLARVEQELSACEASMNMCNRDNMDPDPKLSLCIGAESYDKVDSCNCRLELEDRLRSTIIECSELRNQMELTDTKCDRWKLDSERSSIEAEQLRSQVQELQMELGSRIAALQGLKTKIAEQYVESAEIEEQRRRFERDGKALQIQLDTRSKSEHWYREQLHACQVARASLEKTVMTAREDAEEQRRRAERQAAEVRRLQEQLKDAAERAVRNKEAVTRQLETALSKAGAALPVSFVQPPPTNDHAVAELQQVVSDLQVSLKSSAERLEGATGENDRLLRRALYLQQELCDCKVQLQQQQEVCQSAEVDRDTAQAELRERDKMVAQLSRENTELSVHLSCAQRDRTDLTDAMTSLTRNFTNVSSQWRASKADHQAQLEAVEAAREEARMALRERDALMDRAEQAERRELVLKRRLDELEGAATKAAHLEHELLAVRDCLNRARCDSASLETAQRSAVVLEKTAADMSKRNEHLQAQVEGLSQLLQVNTGSRIEDPQQLQLRARVEQLQAENSHLHQQVARSTTRLAELSKTIEVLEKEMDAVKQQGELRASWEKGEGDSGEADRLAASLEEANARLRAQSAELQQLREERAALRRDKLDLTERERELTSWLNAMKDGAELGLRHEIRERTMDRLSTTPVIVSVAEVPGNDRSGCGDTLNDQLKAYQDANAELAQLLDSLQRRVEDSERDRPDLLQPSVAPPTSEAEDVLALLVLLRVCLHRARGLSAKAGTGTTGQGDDLAQLSFRAAEAEVEQLLGTLVALSMQLDTAVLALQHRDAPSPRPPSAERRDELVRALFAHMKQHQEARRAAEEQLAALQSRLPGDSGDDSQSATKARRDRVASLEQELAGARNTVKDLHKQLFAERRDSLQLRKEVGSLRVGLDTANDMLDNNKIALGRSEAYGEMLKVSKEQIEVRLEAEQRDHEECRVRAEQLAAELQDVRAKDPLLAAQIKTLGCHLHQRTGEVRALQDRLDLCEDECRGLRAQLERHRETARGEQAALQRELQQARQEFSAIVCQMNSAMPTPKPCDEEGLSELIRQSSQLSPLVLDDLQNLLRNLKADLAAVGRETGLYLENKYPLVQHV